MWLVIIEGYDEYGFYQEVSKFENKEEAILKFGQLQGKGENPILAKSCEVTDDC